MCGNISRVDRAQNWMRKCLLVKALCLAWENVWNCTGKYLMAGESNMAWVNVYREKCVALHGKVYSGESLCCSIGKCYKLSTNSLMYIFRIFQLFLNDLKTLYIYMYKSMGGLLRPGLKSPFLLLCFSGPRSQMHS